MYVCLFFLPLTHAFTIAVCGAHGGLGRELVQQSIEREWKTVAIVRRPEAPIFKPYRDGWLSDDQKVRTSISAQGLLTKVSYEDVTIHYDALVFALGGKPLQTDTTTATVASMCANLPETCAKVCLVSAHGVGDSLRGADVGIRTMSSWYLRDTYRSKRLQEEIVDELSVETRIVRPRVLSYGPIPLNPIATSREDLARDILDWSS